MWAWLRRERAERQFNPLLNPPVKSVKSSFLPFAFRLLPRQVPFPVHARSRLADTHVTSHPSKLNAL